MSQTLTCDKIIWQGFHNYVCGKPAKMEVGGKHYCGIHDPAAVKARDERGQAKRRANQTINQGKELARAVQLLRDNGYTVYVPGQDPMRILGGGAE